MPRLLQAWEAFRKEKTNKRDVQVFSLRLEDNLFALHSSLKREMYQHGIYESFWVNDPKRRHIHKACVTDRVLHHLLYSYLYELFDSTFIYDSYSCRLDKGTHKGVERLVTFARKESTNYTKACWALQFDIKQFFASADHAILKQLLIQKISDERILRLLSQVIDSFHSTVGLGKGIPLGNLTSQIFANIYLHELDTYMKHTHKARFYIRYADDFVILSESKGWLLELISPISTFLADNLDLELNTNKVFVKSLAIGVDFLGWVHFFDHRVLRTTTARRMKRRLEENPLQATLASYIALTKHGNTFKLRSNIVKGLLSEQKIPDGMSEIF